MIIPKLQIGPLGSGLQKKIASQLTLAQGRQLYSQFSPNQHSEHNGEVRFGYDTLDTKSRILLANFVQRCKNFPQGKIHPRSQNSTQAQLQTKNGYDLLIRVCPNTLLCLVCTNTLGVPLYKGLSGRTQNVSRNNQEIR